MSRRAGVSPDEAREGVRAELSTLTDAVSDGEFRHVISQLPRDFEALVGAGLGRVSSRDQLVVRVRSLIQIIEARRWRPER
ncbi:DUF2267 domain-containing protein [Streptomyces avermitilis]|uniref:DUF2267 domain-containing protein n=1 Tax=Streptomyces avermitilis TaxID=33903 RepID=UPI0036A524FC